MTDRTHPKGWARALDELMGRLGPRFGRVEPRRRALAYLRGLLAPVGRKNGWQLAEAAGDRTPDGMQDFLGTRGKTPGTSKPLIELIFSNITTSPTRGCEEVLHRIAQRPIAIYSGAKVINPNIFLRLLLNFQLAIRNRQTISIRGAE